MMFLFENKNPVTKYENFDSSDILTSVFDFF